jgi:hypothetical protein
VPEESEMNAWIITLIIVAAVALLLINAEGEALAASALGDASDTMMAHPLALQLRNLQSLVEIAVDKNSTVVFPAPLMSTIGELSHFLEHEASAARATNSAPIGRPLTAAH